MRHIWRKTFFWKSPLCYFRCLRRKKTSRKRNWVTKERNVFFSWKNFSFFIKAVGIPLFFFSLSSWTKVLTLRICHPKNASVFFFLLHIWILKKEIRETSGIVFFFWTKGKILKNKFEAHFSNSYCFILKHSKFYYKCIFIIIPFLSLSFLCLQTSNWETDPNVTGNRRSEQRNCCHLLDGQVWRYHERYYSEK